MLDAIGKELRVIRFRSGKTLDDLAIEFNINRETLRRYENSANGLSVRKLVKLLEYYNVPINIFFENVCANTHFESEEK